MNGNYYVSKVEPVRNGDGTNVYFTFSYPDSGSQLNGNVKLTNQEYIDALNNGTADDMYSGLYKAIKAKIIEINTVTTTTTTTTKEA
jgi:hexokinase